jgi:hypothetical protein
MDYAAPFQTWIPGGASGAEIEALFQRQGAIESLLEGKESVDTVLDMIDEHGLDSLAYVGEVERTIDAVIWQNIPIEYANLLLELRD